jgi:hypothetical protein
MAAGRKKGIKAAAQDNFIVPNAPTIGTATDVGTARAYNNGAATVTFTPATSGNTAVVSGYTATSSPGSFTGTSATSPITVTGLQSNTAYTFTVVANSAYGSSAASSASASITATTVPQAPTIGTTTTSGDAPQGDTVNWTINANGGSAITGNTVVSSDGPTYAVGAAVTTKLVAETAGTSQSYQVFSTNANGNSANSASSNTVTTPSPFSFAPFGFTPFGFTPFAPFGFTPFAPFGFTPFGFTPFGFTPFGFTPFGPSYSEYSVARNTGVLTVDGRKPASELQVGDKLYGMNIPSENVLDWTSWQSSDIVLNSDNVVETEIVSINLHQTDKIYSINGDLYSGSHYVLTKKDDVVKFTRADEIDSTYFVYSYAAFDFEAIISVEAIDYEETVYSINCEPYDNFFTDNMLVFDSKDKTNN